MKHKKVLLSIELAEEKTARTKARADVMEILLREGYHAMPLPAIRNIQQLVSFWKKLSATVAKDGHIVLEYPCAPRRLIFIIATFAFVKRIKLYGVIHDINHLRYPDQKEMADIRFLKRFDGLVSHNPSMTKWLKEQGFKKTIIDLNIFDYCLQEERNFSETTVNGKMKVLYAGNLAFSKAAYIYDKHMDQLEHVNLCVYGQSFEKDRVNGSKVSYKGMFNPNSPDLGEKYHFGLIWEGDSVDTCRGPFGRYIRYNNPHKFSLYLSLGLPVIVWKEAAIAPFIIENNLGFTIGSFKEIETISEKVTDAQYKEYLSNVSRFSGKVRKGHFLSKALSQLVN